MIFWFPSVLEDPVPWERMFRAHRQLEYTLVCKVRGTAREVKHQWVLAKVNEVETISGRSGGMAKGRNWTQLCGRQEVSWVLCVGCTLRSRHCLGFLDTQWKHNMGKNFCLLKTGVGIQSQLPELPQDSVLPLWKVLFSAYMRKNFFTLRVTEHWDRLPREVVESPSLEMLKTCLDKVLCSLL